MIYFDDNNDGLEGPRRNPRAQHVLELVRKYEEILESESGPPHIVVRHNIASGWLGRTKWTARNPDVTVIELQRSILDDDATLERVVAHEMVHHVELTQMTDEEVEDLRHGVRPKAHGKKFLRLAAKINKEMGEDFVTVTSDQSYVQKNTKQFFVLIVPLDDGKRLGYAWAVRLTPKASAFADRSMRKGALLARTTDLRWTHGAKMGSLMYSVPQDIADQKKLMGLYLQTFRELKERVAERESRRY